MRDIITITVNPVIDIHYFMEDFQTGRDNIVSCRKIFAAGKGMNVSRALQAFGISAETFLALGRENAPEYLQLASDYGVPLSYVSVGGRIRENISINTPVSETRICTKNFAVTPDAFAELRTLIARKTSPEAAIVFSGSLPNGIAQKEFADFALSVKGDFPDRKIILDCPSLSLETIASIAPFLIKPNQSEAMSLLGLRGQAEESLSQKEILSAERLRMLGRCVHVVVSCGAAGAAYASCGGRSGFVSAPDPGTVCSTVGAGDSMLAGILYGFFYKNAPDLRSALSWGVAFGSAACLTRGTCPPEKELVFKLLSEME